MKFKNKKQENNQLQDLGDIIDRRKYFNKNNKDKPVVEENLIIEETANIGINENKNQIENDGKPIVILSNQEPIFDIAIKEKKSFFSIFKKSSNKNSEVVPSVIVADYITPIGARNLKEEIKSSLVDNLVNENIAIEEKSIKTNSAYTIENITPALNFDLEDNIQDIKTVQYHNNEEIEVIEIDFSSISPNKSLNLDNTDAYTNLNQEKDNIIDIDMDFLYESKRNDVQKIKTISKDNVYELDIESLPISKASDILEIDMDDLPISKASDILESDIDELPISKASDILEIDIDDLPISKASDILESDIDELSVSKPSEIEIDDMPVVSKTPDLIDLDISIQTKYNEDFDLKENNYKDKSISEINISKETVQNNIEEESESELLLEKNHLEQERIKFEEQIDQERIEEVRRSKNLELELQKEQEDLTEERRLFELRIDQERIEQESRSRDLELELQKEQEDLAEERKLFELRIEQDRIEEEKKISIESFSNSDKPNADNRTFVNPFINEKHEITSLDFLRDRESTLRKSKEIEKNSLETLRQKVKDEQSLIKYDLSKNVDVISEELNLNEINYNIVSLPIENDVISIVNKNTPIFENINYKFFKNQESFNILNINLSDKPIKSLKIIQDELSKNNISLREMTSVLSKLERKYNISTNNLLQNKKQIEVLDFKIWSIIKQYLDMIDGLKKVNTLSNSITTATFYITSVFENIYLPANIDKPKSIGLLNIQSELKYKVEEDNNNYIFKIDCNFKFDSNMSEQLIKKNGDTYIFDKKHANESLLKELLEYINIDTFKSYLKHNEWNKYISNDLIYVYDELSKNNVLRVINSFKLSKDLGFNTIVKELENIIGLMKKVKSISNSNSIVLTDKYKKKLKNKEAIIEIKNDILLYIKVYKINYPALDYTALINNMSLNNILLIHQELIENYNSRINNLFPLLFKGETYEDLKSMFDKRLFFISDRNEYKSEYNLKEISQLYLDLKNIIKFDIND